MGGVPDAGAIYLWKGGSPFTSGYPDATLANPTAVTADQLGN